MNVSAEIDHIRELCLTALMKTDGRVKAPDDFMGPSIKIEIEGVASELIGVALEGLREDALVAFPPYLLQYARITEDGRKYLGELAPTSPAFDYEYRVSSENPDIEHENFQTFTVHIEPKTFIPNDDEPSVFGAGLLGGAILGEPILGSLGPPMSHPTMGLRSPGEARVRASDRYVSVRDNQEPFDQLEKSLDAILAEFAADHGKNNALGSVNAEYLKAEISAVKAQIHFGYVSSGQLLNRLKPSLETARDLFAAIAGLKTAIDVTLGILGYILSLFR